MAAESLTFKNQKWCPWEIRRGRPDKVLGCQDTSFLPVLGDELTFCEEGNQCFYFSCVKCCPLLGLDTFNAEYKTKVEYIPRIECIDSLGPFEEDNKYHGEIFEVYLKFFARMELLIGIAINGWSNLDCRRVFHNVENTFQGCGKFSRTKDFEIDWILFDGYSLTVIEVKERGETAKKQETGHFEKKLDQIRKDRIIIQHLLEVTGCSNIKVNYIIACPNVSIGEVAEGKFLERHSHLCHEIRKKQDCIGFISEESLTKQSVYVYDEGEKRLKEQSFMNLLNRHLIDSNSIQWDDNYRLLASTLIISKLMFGASKRFTDSEAVDKKLPKSRKGHGNLHNIPLEIRDHFPECLILGPEQQVVLRKKSDRIFLYAEPGTGKSFVLLAMLFMCTAKCWYNHPSPKFKKVLFVIPKQKTEFRKYVEKFIEDYCVQDCVELSSVLNVSGIDRFDLLLIDEYPMQWLKIVDTVLTNSTIRICGTGFQEEILTDVPDLSKTYSRWSLMYLRNAYRCPANISMRYVKLRRFFLSPFYIEKIHLALLLESGGPVLDEGSIRVESYVENYRECEAAMAGIDFESSLLITDLAGVLRDESLTSKFSHVQFIRVMGNIGSPTSFSFTGCQYNSVLVIIGNPHLISSIHSFDQISFSTVLYHAISRVLKTFTLICQEKDYVTFHKLLSLSELDIQVFDKLRHKRKVSLEHFPLLKTYNEKVEAALILIITKYADQFKEMQHLFLDVAGKVSSLLSDYLFWGEKGEIVTMAESFKSEPCFQDMGIDGLEFLLGPYLEKSSHLKSYERNLLPRINKLMVKDLTVYIENHLQNDMPKVVNILIASCRWCDKPTFSACVSTIRAFLRRVQANIFADPPQDDRIWENLQNDCDQFFDKYSSLNPNEELVHKHCDLRTVEDEIFYCAVNYGMPKYFDFTGREQLFRKIFEDKLK